MTNTGYTCYSVLMAVYDREKRENLRKAMDSIICQTLPTDDFVLVCDGPLNAELDSVIEEKKGEMGDVLTVIRLERHAGLWNALNEGIVRCRNELVARMDSDDISFPDRAERQVAVFNSHPDVSVCSGTVEEFTSDSDVPGRRRTLPETNEEIVRFAKRRCPFNHPCVMYRKSAVLAVGGYEDIYLMEDYHLWVRLLARGYRGYNIKEPILHMRAGSEMYLRRSGVKYARTQVKFFSYMRKTGFITWPGFLTSSMLRSFSALAPNRLRMLLVGKMLRK